MYRAQILLDPEQHQTLRKIARQEKRSVSDLVREMIERQLKDRQKQALSAAARALLDDYQNNADLIVFNALDGEDFHAEG